MGFLARLLFWLALPATIIGIPAAFAWLALERQPLIARTAELTPRDVRQARSFWRQYDPSGNGAGGAAAVVATERQLDTAVRFGLSALPRVKSRVSVDDQGVKLMATAELALPVRAIPRFANVRAVFVPSPAGLTISRASIGRLNVPPSLALPLLENVIDRIAGPGIGADVVGAVRVESIKGKRVSVAFNSRSRIVAEVEDRPVETSKSMPEKKQEKKPEEKPENKPEKKPELASASAPEKVVRVGDPDAVQAYYTKLVELTRRQGSIRQTSLTAFVQPVFRLARERSKTGNPLIENKAAILALSIYFGDRRIQGVLDDMLRADVRRKKPPTEHVKLEGRHDFVQHFVTSAGLALVGSAAMANAAGVAKEIGDSDSASGFNFTDLAADRAGVRFARAAVASREEAVRFQRRLSDLITEGDIFPAVRDLPEGLSGSEFKRRYGDTNSRAYHRLVAEIDRRIGKITLYQ